MLSNLAHAVPYRPMRWREQCGKKQRGKHKRKKEDRRKDTSAHIGEMPCDISMVIGVVTRASHVTLRACVCVCAGASVRAHCARRGFQIFT